MWSIMVRILAFIILIIAKSNFTEHDEFVKAFGNVNDSIEFDTENNHDEPDSKMEDDKDEANEEVIQTGSKQDEVIDLDSIVFVVNRVKEKTFTWVTKILAYSFKNKYLVVHDLMKGICLLNHNTNIFSFKHESLCMVDSSLILTSHKVNNSLFLCQNDKGVVYMLSTKRRRVKAKIYVWELYKIAEYNVNERITAFYSISKDEIKTTDVVFSTCEGNIYNIKILNEDMINFMPKIQFSVLKKNIKTSEEEEELLKQYEKGFGNGFNGDLISKFFSYDTKDIKKLLSEIKADSIVNFNLLSVKMLFI